MLQLAFVLAGSMPLAVACSSSSSRPGELGNCVPVLDGGCNPQVIGGGRGGPADGGGVDTGLEDVAAGGCGTAQDIVASVTQNPACTPCIVQDQPNGCCAADLACSSESECLNLLSCIVACNAGDSICIGSCQNQHPTGVTAYDDFAGCLSTVCSPECPSLPTQVNSDF